ncbi:MAG: type II secretion system minor pseudopilin GspK [Pseudomonadota bacterium]
MVQRQRGGVTILFSLLVLTLLISVVGGVSYDMALDLRRTQSMLYQEQARLIAVGAEGWIGNLLRDDRLDNENDHLGELWAQPLPPLPIDGAGMSGIVSGAITDLQGRFNLNNLLTSDGLPDEIEFARFERLLRNLGIDTQIANAVIDWMDPDTEVRFPGGAEDDLYATRLPALKAANQFFRSADELAIIEGIDKPAFDLLRPHVVALPERTPINANTATLAILTALDDAMSANDAQEIAEQRFEQGLDDIDVAFAGLLPAETIDTLTTETSYFQVRSVVRIGTTRFTMYSLVFRDQQGAISVLLRTFGTPI